MKSLKRRFYGLKEDYSRQKERCASSDLIIFNAAVKGQRFSRPTIGVQFKLVDPEDYAGCNVREILAYADYLSNGLNRHPKKGKLPSGDDEREEDDGLDVGGKNALV